MKKNLYISLLFIVLFSIIKTYNFVPIKNNLRTTEEKYQKLKYTQIKKYMDKRNVFIIDTRNNTISNKGYIKNSLILPLTMDYAKWLPSLVNKYSYIILICDEDNYKKAIQSTEELNMYRIIGYAIYDDIIENGVLNIEIVEYNENTKKDVEKLVQKGKYLLDIREIKEFEETGVIKEASLIPLSTFKGEKVDLPENEVIYVFCKSGGRALLGMTYLKRAGFDNKFIIMRGGMTKTIQEGYPLAQYNE